MRIFRRPRENYDDAAATEVMWGVPRREGLSDTDDPSAHSGVMQHAFEFGRDERAICGFEPPKRPSRAYRDARSQLAVPGRDNPKCRKCEVLVASRVRGDKAVPVMDRAAREAAAKESVEADVATPTPEEAVADSDAEPAPPPGMIGEREIGGEQAEAQAHTEVEEAATDEQTPESARAPEAEQDGDAEPATDFDQTAVSEQVAVSPQAEEYEPTAELEPTPSQQPSEDEHPADQAADDELATEYEAEYERSDLDSLSSARDPGFHPRAQPERARRRSVRRGGTVLIGPGRRSVVIEVPISTGVAGIVANVETAIEDVRVEAVTVGNDGTARVTLNRPAPAAVEVAWYIVSNPFRETA
jgi:hypothetical protein